MMKNNKKKGPIRDWEYYKNLHEANQENKKHGKTHHKPTEPKRPKQQKSNHAKTGDVPVYKKYQSRNRNNHTEAEHAFSLILRGILKPIRVGYETQRVFFPYQEDDSKFFIIDFYIPDPFNLAFEIDGGYHDTQVDYDQWRQSVIEKSGIKVIRFTNDQVTKTPYIVAREVKSEIERVRGKKLKDIPQDYSIPTPKKSRNKAKQPTKRPELKPAVSEVEFPKIFSSEYDLKTWAACTVGIFKVP
jgi:very-short-patch-repair endonuclease